ncbi:Bicarbonate transport system permease protein CmpB [Halioglobus japonicus]|nr:Bicarbonate transport system permease protein CmpB [Halioglobus japonicus]
MRNEALRITPHERLEQLVEALRGGNWLKALVFPMLGILAFLMVWHLCASRIDTSLGQFPGPVQVWEQVQNLGAEHVREREKAAAFYERLRERNAKKLAADPNAVIKDRQYTGKPTFADQIITSLLTVAAGFLIANLIAIPLGIVCGLSSGIYKALNPVIQVLKPVSPLAWLPLVTMVVSATYSSDDSLFDKSFLNSAITVALCCLWPTLINTIVGVTNIDRDLVNVSRVMALSPMVHVRKIVIPAAIPMIFTGLRLSLATGWMVLIAAEMLAQNPGLGKFVWDEFQNGSSSSLGRIMVAVLAIGLIGFMLDKLMLTLQKRVSWDKTALLR